MVNKRDSDPNQLIRQWESFIQDNRYDNSLVRDVVVRSWQRCKDLKVDPFTNKILPVKPIELKERIEVRRHLVETARPFMRQIYSLIRGSGYQVVLADEEGLLLEVLGDPQIIRRTRQVQLSPGGNWNELIKGTNAIGTAIAEDQPVQIHGIEHFCRPNHFLTCSAAPIHSPDGRMIGILDVTGDSFYYNPHTLAMVIATVTAIEKELRVKRETARSYFYLSSTEDIADRLGEGIVTIDNNGAIVHMNRTAARMLKTDRDSNTNCLLGDLLSVINNDTPHNLQGHQISIVKSEIIKDHLGHKIGETIYLREVQEPQTNRPYTAYYHFGDIVGSSPSIQRAKILAIQAARSRANVLIYGESGTGKELFAQSIHNASSYKNGPFIPVHCAAIPETLLESELFGYEDGAFTGARRGGQVGKFELAQGGTIFLDEISELSPSGQVKLLRVLQTRKVLKLGSKTEIDLDIRVISATNKELLEETARGAFRKDLYYRLNVIPIRIPPLRERLEDIPELVRHFVDKLSKTLCLEEIKITEGLYSKLMHHDWQGNVRELENVMERAIALMDKDCTIHEGLVLFDDPLINIKATEPHKTTQRDCSIAVVDNGTPLSQIELKVIMDSIKRNNGNVSKTALQLGISRATLYRRLKTLRDGLL